MKLSKKKPQPEAPSFTTKEDHMILDQVTNEHNVTAVDKSIKESLTFSRSNTDLLPKLSTDLHSLRSSRDKDFTKDDDSGEICEYQHQGMDKIK